MCPNHLAKNTVPLLSLGMNQINSGEDAYCVYLFNRGKTHASICFTGSIDDEIEEFLKSSHIV